MMLNVFQNLGKAAKTEGTANSSEALLNGKTKDLTGSEAELFKAMLGEKLEGAKTLEGFKKAGLPENTDHLSQEEKEVLLALKKEGVTASSSKQSNLLDILKGSSQTDVVDSKLLAEQTQLGEVKSPLAKVGLQVGKGKTLNPQTMMLETGMPNLEAQAETKSLNKDTQFLNRLPQMDIAKMKESLSGNKGKANDANITTTMQFSEDFVSTQVNKKNGQKPQVKANRQALNLFSKEQAQIGDSGIIKRVVNSEAQTGKMNFDNTAKEVLSVETRESSSSISPEMMSDNLLNLDGSKQSKMGAQVSTTASSVKVLDLSNISSNQKIIQEVTNYIEANKINSQSELELIVNHKDLGQFKVHTSKSGGDMIDLKIITAGQEGRKFFEAQEVNLLKTLNSNGVKVSDFKLAMSSTSNFMSGNSNHSNNSGQGQDNFSGSNNSGAEGQNSRQYSGNSSSGGNGRERRDELWNQYRQKQNDFMSA